MARPVRKNNPLSKCIRELLTDANLYNTEGIEDVAKVLGKSIPVFRNKLSNGTFSIEELLAIVSITGGEMSIRSRKTKYNFMPEEFCSEETMQRIKEFEEKDKERRIQKIGEALDIDDPEVLKRIYDDMKESARTKKIIVRKLSD